MVSNYRRLITILLCSLAFNSSALASNAEPQKKKWVKLPGPVTIQPPPVPAPPTPPTCVKCERQVEQIKKEIEENAARFGANSLPVAAAADKLGMLYLLMRKYDLAEQQLQKALQLKQTAKSDDADIATSYMHLAALEDFRGNPARSSERRATAAKFFDQFIAQHKEKTPPTVFIERGRLFLAGMDMKSARDYYDRALQAAIKAHGEQHVETAQILESTVALYSAADDYKQGRHYLERALQIRRQIHAPYDAQTRLVVYNEARVLLKNGHPDEGAALLVHAMKDEQNTIMPFQIDQYKNYINELKEKKAVHAARMVQTALSKCKTTTQAK